MNKSWDTPKKLTHTGTYVTLRPLDPQTDAPALYRAGHDSVLHLDIWRYLPYGPFIDTQSMREWLNRCAQSSDPLFHTVIDATLNQAVGIITIMSIVPDAGRAELGHIWYDPRVQRTPITTESAYLLLSYLFDQLNYRRVEWKCDNRNQRSKNAAQRLGFQYEGLFRKHLIVKHHNRDTAWFAMTDDDWHVRKRVLQHYLQNPSARL
jgi:RimJ/RimL family protein N-acetyltransferase